MQFEKSPNWSMVLYEYQNTGAALRFLQANKLLKWTHTPRSCPLFNISHKNIDFAAFRVEWRGTVTFSNVNPLLIGWREMVAAVLTTWQSHDRGVRWWKNIEVDSDKDQRKIFVISSYRHTEGDGGWWVEVIKDTSAFWLQPIPSLVFSNDVCVGASNPPWAN